MCGKLTALDFENVQINVDFDKLSSAFRAVVANILHTSPPHTEIIITLRKIFKDPSKEVYFANNTGLESICIQISNTKIPEDAYPVKFTLSLFLL